MAMTAFFVAMTVLFRARNNFSPLPQLPVFPGADALDFFEHPAEIGALADAHQQPDLLHGLVAEPKEALGLGDLPGKQVVIHRGTVVVLEDFAQVGLVHVEGPRQVRQGKLFHVVLVQERLDLPDIHPGGRMLRGAVRVPGVGHDPLQQHRQLGMDAHIPDIILRGGRFIQRHQNLREGRGVLRMEYRLPAPGQILLINRRDGLPAEMAPPQAPQVLSRSVGIGLAAVEEHHIPRFQRIPLPLKLKLPRPGFHHEAKKRLQPLPPARMPPKRLQGAHLLQMKERTTRKSRGGVEDTGGLDGGGGGKEII